MDIAKEKVKQDKKVKKAKIGQIYIKDKKGNVNFINIEDLIINTKNGDITLSKFINDTELLKQDLMVKMNKLISTLEGTMFIDPNKSYSVYGIKNNYIFSKYDINGVIMENVNIKNITNGCYQAIDNKVVLDEDKLKLKILGG